VTRQLLINCRSGERRVALIENGLTTELFFEQAGKTSVVGNVYKGRVVRVLPGMQAAFVDVGLPRAGFLFVGDIAEARASALADREADGRGEGDAPSSGTSPQHGGSRYPPIANFVKGGDEILVQVTKAPIGTKGARLSTQITLPGRLVVFAPREAGVGVSRRITNSVERDRLRALAETFELDEGGLIVRTAGEGALQSEMTDDVAFLTALWRDIVKRSASAKAPELVHQDVDVTLRSVRDLKLDRVLVDSDTEAKRIADFVDRFAPDFDGRIEVWVEQDPLFERFGLEHEIRRAIRRRVWLRSGGTIIIDRTEALTAIDVNSGKNVGSGDFEQTVLEINLEAVKEIAYQLRFRDIGGLIVIDFIDMASVENQRKVHAALLDALATDKARTRVLEMSALGLIEMTRKRVRDSIVQNLTEPCFYCEGKGYLSSMRVMVTSILGALQAKAASGKVGVLHVTAHPRIIEALVEEHQESLGALEQQYAVDIQVTGSDDLHFETYDVS